MATRKSSTKPKSGATRKRAPAKKAGAKRKKQPAAAAAGATSWFNDLQKADWLHDFKKLGGKFKLPGIDVAAIVDWQRKDIEALTQANRQAYQGLQALAKRRNEILREAFSEWQAAIKESVGTRTLTTLSDTAKRRLEKAIANFKELSELEASTRQDAWKVLQHRMQENLMNLKALLQQK
jgi:phasin family protein